MCFHTLVRAMFSNAHEFTPLAQMTWNKPTGSTPSSRSSTPPVSTPVAVSNWLPVVGPSVRPIPVFSGSVIPSPRPDYANSFVLPVSISHTLTAVSHDASGASRVPNAVGSPTHHTTPSSSLSVIAAAHDQSNEEVSLCSTGELQHVPPVAGVLASMSAVHPPVPLTTATMTNDSKSKSVVTRWCPSTSFMQHKTSLGLTGSVLTPRSVHTIATTHPVPSLFPPQPNYSRSFTSPSIHTGSVPADQPIPSPTATVGGGRTARMKQWVAEHGQTSISTPQAEADATP